MNGFVIFWFHQLDSSPAPRRMSNSSAELRCLPAPRLLGEAISTNMEIRPGRGGQETFTEENLLCWRRFPLNSWLPKEMKEQTKQLFSSVEVKLRFPPGISRKWNKTTAPWMLQICFCGFPDSGVVLVELQLNMRRHTPPRSQKTFISASASPHSSMSLQITWVFQRTP